MAVEMPFANAEVNGGGAGQCSVRFNDKFTAARSPVALQSALLEARRQPGVDQRQIFLRVPSEGAVIARLLATHNERVTDAIAIGPRRRSFRT